MIGMAFSPRPRLKTTVSPDNLESLKAELTETATRLSQNRGVHLIKPR